MLEIGSCLSVIDNSGAKKTNCLKILNKNKQQAAKLGNIIVVSVTQIQKFSALKNKKRKELIPGEILYGIIIQTKKEHLRCSGVKVSFKENSVILLDKKKKPIATRITGIIPYELRLNNFLKIMAIAGGFI